MSKMIEVFVPDIGDFDDVEVIEVLGRGQWLLVSFFVCL